MTLFRELSHYRLNCFVVHETVDFPVGYSRQRDDSSRAGRYAPLLHKVRKYDIVSNSSLLIKHVGELLAF